MQHTANKGQMLYGGSNQVFLGSTFQGHGVAAQSPAMNQPMKQISKRRKNPGDQHKEARQSFTSHKGVMGETQSAQARRRPPQNMPTTALRAPREQQLEEVKEELRGEQQLTDRPGAYPENDQHYHEAVVQGAQGNQGTQGGQEGIQNSLDVLNGNEFLQNEQQASLTRNPMDDHMDNQRNKQRYPQLQQGIPLATGSKVLAQQHRRPQRDWKKATSLYQRGERMARITPGNVMADGTQRVEKAANHPSFRRQIDAQGMAPLKDGSRNANRERSQQIYKTGQASIAGHVIHPLAKSAVRSEKQHFANTQARLKTAGFDADAQMKDSREAYGHHSRAPTSGGGRRVGGGARPLVDLEPQAVAGRRRNEPVQWQIQKDLLEQELEGDGKTDSQNLARYVEENRLSKSRQSKATNNNYMKSAGANDPNQFDTEVVIDSASEYREIRDSKDTKSLAAAERFASTNSRRNRNPNQTVSKLGGSRKRGNGLSLNDHQQETLNIQQATQVSRSMGVTRRHQGAAGSLQNVFAQSALNAASGPQASPDGTGHSSSYSKKKFVQVKKYSQLKEQGKQSEMMPGPMPLQPFNPSEGDSIHPVSLSSQDRPLAPVLPRPIDKIGGSRQATRFDSGSTYAQDFQQARYLLNMLENNPESGAPSHSQHSQSQQTAKQTRKHNQKQKRNVIEQIYKNPFKVSQYQQGVLSGSSTATNNQVNSGRFHSHILSGSRNVHMSNTEQNHQVSQISSERDTDFANQGRRGPASKSNNTRQEIQNLLPKKNKTDNKFDQTERGQTMILKPRTGLALEPLQVPVAQRITKMKTEDGNQMPMTSKHNRERAFALVTESPRYDEMRADEEIEDISDNETHDPPTNNHHAQGLVRFSASNGRSANKRNDQASVGASQSRQRNNRSPLQGMGASAGSQAPVSKNRNKFENAAARYKAEVNDVINQAKGAGFADAKLLAESKGAPGQQKMTAGGQREFGYIGNPQFQTKLKASPYGQVLNPNLASLATGGTTLPGAAYTHDSAHYSAPQNSHKRQLAQRQQRAMLAPTVQGVLSQNAASVPLGSPQQSPSHAQQPTMLQLNHLKVQRAYKAGVGGGHKKPPKQGASSGAKPEKKEELVKNAIDKINLKIDDLHQNLATYEQNIDLTLKEIPRDIRSMNNSNFNNSSSRQQNQETDRQYDKFTNITNRTSHAGNGQGTAKATDIHDAERQEQLLQDNLSEKTLKTILDFHSDRAQTQQQRRMNSKYKHESTQNCGRPPESHLSQQSQINSQECYRLVTSRHSKHRAHGAASGIAGIIGPLGEMNLMGSTEDYRYHNRDFGDPNGFEPATALSIKDNDFQLKHINRHDQNRGIGGEDAFVDSEYHVTGRNGLKDLNLTNLTILSSKVDKDMAINDSAEGQNEHGDGRLQNQAYKQKTEREEKTSFTNLQAYFQQRGINNDTNLSAALSIHNNSAAGGAGGAIPDHSGFVPTPNLNLSNLFGGNNSVVGGGSNYGSGLDGAMPGTEPPRKHPGRGLNQTQNVAPISIPAPRAQTDVLNEAWPAGSAVVGSPGMGPRQQQLQSQNFYPPQAQSRLSQKSAIVDITTPQPTDSGRPQPRPSKANDYE